MTSGHVIGETDRRAEEPVTRPIHYQDVMATLYHNLGIDTASTTIPDLNGQPQYLPETHEPIREFVRSASRICLLPRCRSAMIAARREWIRSRRLPRLSGAAFTESCDLLLKCLTRIAALMMRLEHGKHDGWIGVEDR